MIAAAVAAGNALYGDGQVAITCRDEINEILRRNEVALRQEVSGRVVRLGPKAAQIATEHPLPSSGDATLDAKVASPLADLLRVFDLTSRQWATLMYALLPEVEAACTRAASRTPGSSTPSESVG